MIIIGFEKKNKFIYKNKNYNWKKSLSFERIFFRENILGIKL